MYSVLKRQNRMLLPNGKTISTKPHESERSSPPETDEGTLLAIGAAMRKNRSLYIVRTPCGTTLDIALDRNAALKRTDHGAQVYERKGTSSVMTRIG